MRIGVRSGAWVPSTTGTSWTAFRSVTWAKDGPSGIETALREPVDLILLDIQLPIMDGYAVARALRSHHELADVQIVALTSYAMSGDREKALAAGCTGYIEKPINPNTFAPQIEGFLAANAAERVSS